MKILLVEDNPADVVLIRQCLTAALPCVDIRVAMDGEQAVEMLCDPNLLAELVILDLNIPKIPGISVLARCQTQVPVIVFSSSSSPAEIQRAKELGCTRIRSETHRLRRV